METPFPQIDLRFEQSFVRTLYANANLKYPDPTSAQVQALTDDELSLLAKQVSREERAVRDVSPVGQSKEDALGPLSPIPPSVVFYTVIKDQVLVPLIQGFLWSGFLLAFTPALGIVTRHGRATGKWLVSLVGLAKVVPRTRPAL